MATIFSDVWERSYMYGECSQSNDNSDTEREEIENLLYNSIHFIHSDSDSHTSRPRNEFIKCNEGIKIRPYVKIFDKDELKESKIETDLSPHYFNTVGCILDTQTNVEPFCTSTEFNRNLSDVNEPNEFENNLEEIKEVRNKDVHEKIIYFPIRSPVPLGSGEKKQIRNTLLDTIKPNVVKPTELVYLKLKGGKYVEKKSKKKKLKTETDIYTSDEECSKNKKRNKKSRRGKKDGNLCVDGKTDICKSDEDCSKIKKQTNRSLRKKKCGNLCVNKNEVIEISSDLSSPIPAPKIKRYVDESEYTVKKTFNDDEIIVISSTSEEKNTPIKGNRKKEVVDAIVISDSEPDKALEAKSKLSESESDDEYTGVLLQPDDADDKENLKNLKTNVLPGQESLLNKPCNSEKDWKVADDDKYNHIHRMPRYFQPSSSAIHCRNCSKPGHTSRFCPEPKKLVCIFCGTNDHQTRKCPESYCFICKCKKHISMHCPCPKAQLATKCKRCSMLGHHQSVCPDLWRQYHMTTEGDEPVKVKRKENKNRRCYNCGAKKHFGYECKNRRMDKYSSPTNPFIVRYDKDSNKEPVKKKRKLAPKNNKTENSSRTPMYSQSFGERKNPVNGTSKINHSQIWKAKNNLKDKSTNGSRKAKSNIESAKIDDYEKSWSNKKRKKLWKDHKKIRLDDKEKKCLRITDSWKGHEMIKQKSISAPINRKSAPYKNNSGGFKVSSRGLRLAMENGKKNGRR